MQGLTPADFEEPGPFFRMGREPVGVDIFTAIPGVEFYAACRKLIDDGLHHEEVAELLNVDRTTLY